MNNRLITAEILYIDDCPSWKNAGVSLSTAMEDLGVYQEIVFTMVESEAKAIKDKFTGSPMILINGISLFPVEHKNYSLGCRVFNIPEGLKGWPTKEMCAKKLRQELNLK